jgi:arylsulfatase A-like enzyme
VVRYGGEIRFADTVIGEILDALDERGLRDSTVVVFTSDHGESMTEHNVYFNHGLFPYEGQVRIPLIVRGPGLAEGVRRPEQVSLVGLMPTLLDLVDVPVPDHVEAQPFTHLLETGTPESEGTPTFVSTQFGAHAGTRGVRTNRWKYMERAWGERPAKAFRLSTLLIPARRMRHDLGGLRDYELSHELYDLENDPAEEVNLAWRRHEVRERLAAELASFSRQAAPVGPLPRFLEYSELDADVGEELRQLGYIDH